MFIGYSYWSKFHGCLGKQPQIQSNKIIIFRFWIIFTITILYFWRHVQFAYIECTYGPRYGGPNAHIALMAHGMVKARYALYIYIQSALLVHPSRCDAHRIYRYTCPRHARARRINKRALWQYTSSALMVHVHDDSVPRSAYSRTQVGQWCRTPLGRSHILFILTLWVSTTCIVIHPTKNNSHIVMHWAWSC